MRSLAALHILSAHPPHFIFKAFGMGPSSAATCVRVCVLCIVSAGLVESVFELQHIGMPNGSRVSAEVSSIASVPRAAWFSFCRILHACISMRVCESLCVCVCHLDTVTAGSASGAGWRLCLIEIVFGISLGRIERWNVQTTNGNL